jgi:molecular chaperone GrpE
MSEPKEGSQDEEEGTLEVLERKLEAERKRNEDLLTRLKYAQADLENYRKRMDKELKEAGESHVKALVGRLLVVQDELELAVKHANEGPGGSEMLEGLKMVQRNLLSSLEAAGVERIEAAGRPFDPAIHEAVARVQGDKPGEDMVVDEIRPGFTFRGQVLRPSMVKVELATKPARQEASLNE